jgi:hypothetical protein
MMKVSVHTLFLIVPQKLPGQMLNFDCNWRRVIFQPSILDSAISGVSKGLTDYKILAEFYLISFAKY